MANLQANTIDAGLLHDINLISGDESLMKRLTRYVSKLVREKADDPTLMTKEEFFRMIDEAREEARQGKVRSFDSVEDFDKYIRSLP
jgi:hypothetical protein